MNAKMIHFNFNVLDLEKSLSFYEKALGFHEVRRKTAEDGSFTIAFLQGAGSDFELELTWLAGRTERYDLGDEEFHLAVSVGDVPAARKLHDEMGCVCYVNESMGIYFINDPDGYWIEICK